MSGISDWVSQQAGNQPTQVGTNPTSPPTSSNIAAWAQANNIRPNAPEVQAKPQSSPIVDTLADMAKAFTGSAAQAINDIPLGIIRGVSSLLDRGHITSTTQASTTPYVSDFSKQAQQFSDQQHSATQADAVNSPYSAFAGSLAGSALSAVTGGAALKLAIPAISALGGVAQAALGGAAYGAVTDPGHDESNRVLNTAIGGATGALVGALGHALGKFTESALPADQQALKATADKAGVQLSSADLTGNQAQLVVKDVINKSYLKNTQQIQNVENYRNYVPTFIQQAAGVADQTNPTSVMEAIKTNNQITKNIFDQAYDAIGAQAKAEGATIPTTNFKAAQESIGNILDVLPDSEAGALNKVITKVNGLTKPDGSLDFNQARDMRTLLNGILPPTASGNAFKAQGALRDALVNDLGSLQGASADLTSKYNAVTDAYKQIRVPFQSGDVQKVLANTMDSSGLVNSIMKHEETKLPQVLNTAGADTANKAIDLAKQLGIQPQGTPADLNAAIRYKLLTTAQQAALDTSNNSAFSAPKFAKAINQIEQMPGVRESNIFSPEMMTYIKGFGKLGATIGDESDTIASGGNIASRIGWTAPALVLRTAMNSVVGQKILTNVAKSGEDLDPVIRNRMIKEINDVYLKSGIPSFSLLAGAAPLSAKIGASEQSN